jgi:hypothetical protein
MDTTLSSRLGLRRRPRLTRPGRGRRGPTIRSGARRGEPAPAGCPDRALEPAACRRAGAFAVAA